MPARTVIYFEVSEEVMTERLLGRAKTSGRVDDNIDTIKLRLKTFMNSTKPVVDYYESKGKLAKVAEIKCSLNFHFTKHNYALQINAEGSVDDVFKATVPVMDKIFH